MKVKHIVLAEYFMTEDPTLLFIVREDSKEPVVREIKMPLSDIHQYVTDNFGITEGGTMKVRELDVDEWQRRFGQFIEPVVPYAEKGDTVWIVPHDVQ